MKSFSPNSAAGQKTQSWHQAQDRARYTPMHKTLQSSFHPQNASSGCGEKKSAIGVEKPSCELMEIPKIEAQWELSTLSTRLRAVVIRGASGCRAKVFWEDIMKLFIKEWREKDKKGRNEMEEMDKLLERRWRFLVEK